MLDAWRSVCLYPKGINFFELLMQISLISFISKKTNYIRAFIIWKELKLISQWEPLTLEGDTPFNA